MRSASSRSHRGEATAAEAPSATASTMTDTVDALVRGYQISGSTETVLGVGGGQSKTNAVWNE